MYYLIAFIEWFSTLAVEVIAIRLASWVIWGNIVSTSIFLWVILLALSLWYVLWWKLSNIDKNKLKYIFAIWLFLWWIYYILFSFLFEKQLLTTLLQTTWNYIITVFLVSFLLFFIPVILVSISVPILTQLLKTKNKWEASWKILFFSTVWSFLWSVITSIVFFPILWVHLTSILVWEMLIIISSIYIFKYNKLIALIFIIFWIIAWIVNYSFKNNNSNIVYEYDSSYQNIKVANWIISWERVNLFLSNDKFYSWIYEKDKKVAFGYLKEAVNLTKTTKPSNILVLGTAWFAYPYNVSKFDYTSKIDAVDIDPSVKYIAEKHFLKTSIPKKVNFHPIPSRLFLEQSKSKYDLIFLDAFLWLSIPHQLTTVEFFEQLKRNWKTIIINIILDENLDSSFSEKFISTLDNVFPNIYYKKIWNWKIGNFILTNNKFEWYTKIIKNKNIYKDNKQTTEIDFIKMYYLSNKKNYE